MPQRRRPLLAVALLAACATVLPGCGGSNDEKPAGDAQDAAAPRAKGKGARFGRGAPGAGAPEPAVPVIVGAVTVDTMEAFLDASSTFEAEAQVEVVSQATGIVAELGVEEGDRVSRDDLLARLAYEDLELAEARARSELERLQNDFARAEKLSKESFISEEEFQRIRFDLARAEIDWRTARLNLDRTRIAAPIPGTVTERMINVGQLVRENEPVYRIVDFESLVAPVFVPEKYLGDLHVGQAAVLTTRGGSEEPVRGRVKRIAPVVDGQSGTVRVVIDLPSDPTLRPGMFADVQLVLDAHEDVVVVPKKALVYEDELPHVFVVQAGKAVRTPVVLGYQDAGRAEIVDGLDVGATVVLVGQSTLKDGSPVAAENESGEPLDAGAPADVTAVAVGEPDEGGTPRRPRGAATSAGS